MLKNITFTVAILVSIFFIFLQNDKWRHISPDMVYSAIISTDGYIIPGQKQDFLVNIFKENNGKRILESKANFGIKITMPLVNGKNTEVILPLECKMAGKYITSYNFPENLDFSNIDVSLFPDKRTDKRVMNCQIPIRKEKAIIIQPPDCLLYTGDNIKFRLASTDKKTGLSIFKVPVRVKLIAPSGFTTLNRVVTTDTEGLANFDTNIHKASPEGFYTFVFNSDNFEQKISLYVKKGGINKAKIHSLDSIPAYSPPYGLNENCGYIFNLNCQKDGSLMAYGCPDSDHRQIEIWQNGKLHYYSNLDLEGGTVSLIMNKPLLSGCPALFKVWQIKENKVSSHEKIRYIQSNHPTKVGQFLNEVNSEFQNTNRDKLAASFSRKGFLGVSSKLDVENLTQIYSQDLKTITPKPQNEIPISYYEKLLKDNDNALYKKIDFHLVENEIDISNFKEAKVILDTKTFLTHYIDSLDSNEENLYTILQEALCRVDRYNLLDIPTQKEELKNLEALLIPISEAYCYLNKFQEQKTIYKSSILSTVNKIKNILFIPAEFSFDIGKYQDNLNNYPMLDIKPINRSLQSIQGLLHPKGKIMLTNKNLISSLTIELNENEINLPSYKYEKITNLRSIPLILETKN